MRKVDDGKRKEKRKKRKEKNGVFSGHYVIASSLPPERLRPNDDRWNAKRSCQLVTSQHYTDLAHFNIISSCIIVVSILKYESILHPV